MNNYDYFMNTIRYDYSLNKYGHWDAEYDTIISHYGKKYYIIVVGQPYHRVLGCCKILMCVVPVGDKRWCRSDGETWSWRFSVDETGTAWGRVTGNGYCIPISQEYDANYPCPLLHRRGGIAVGHLVDLQHWLGICYTCYVHVSVV